MTLGEVFHPLSSHADLEQRFSRAIRVGYRHRNPLAKQTKLAFSQLRENLENTKNRDVYRVKYNKIRSTILGFNILGVAGTGKTITVEMILNLYKQVIYHSSYKGSLFTFIQIVWLKVDCPYDASPEGLCQNILMAIDNILGTNYTDMYLSRDVNKMLLHIAQLSYRHGIGVIVVDEIQRLSDAKGDDANAIMEFLTQLINVVGQPIVLIGTPRARDFVSQNMSQIRRGISQGYPYWRNMEEDKEWTSFCKAIWVYQYTTTPTPLTPELTHRLYYESTGIADLAVKLYSLSQIRAIQNRGAELITVDLLNSVARDTFLDAKDMIRALRAKDYQELTKYPDVQLFDTKIVIPNCKPNASQTAEIVETTINTELRKQQNKHIEEKGIRKTTQTGEKIRSKQSKFEVPEGGLLAIAKAAEKHKVGIYDALVDAGYIKEVTELLGENSCL